MRASCCFAVAVVVVDVVVAVVVVVVVVVVVIVVVVFVVVVVVFVAREPLLAAHCRQVAVSCLFRVVCILQFRSILWLFVLWLSWLLRTATADICIQ